VPYSAPFDHLVRIAFLREQVTRNFLRRRNVLACGVGFKIKGGQETGIPSVVVSVVRKQPPSVLPLSDLIPPLVDNVPTDVVETGPIVPLAIDRQGVVRPVRPGVSIGHRDGTAGTAGCIVQRGSERFLLSANHVLALLNSAQIGDPILQPGPSDGGTLENAFGELAGYERVRFTDEPSSEYPGEQPPATQQPAGCAALLARLLQLWGGEGTSQPTFPAPPLPSVSSSPYENRVDAALVRPYSGVSLDPNILDIDSPPSGIADPKLGLRVYKSGRSTALTSGLITQVDVTVDVQYGSRTARYANQIMITPFTQRGDSGALVVDEQRQAVGLIFSGSDQVSVANPIRFVLAALRVSLITA